ncbi:MAG: aminoacyl-tRNA hydrolase [Candidatus Yonathbacteria bacterium CG_4_10_14_3_um_filter_47_65]|uniref:Aminoacyl-tRNA hydrolase n=2 Tax=Parcubacteria group TaxID=1794811 RepID=A0A2M8DA44_9BACT|nr:MAG: hypothetical protein AUJ44_03180 [Candidatus Nomurabacteria bacterium CG1_02_47_685]PIP03637.1 MAG: aminoacyl-tRNA hydrolase [Candidatus Yonathbacteria bacterium CG23_combo_of_CG06-09_8_20_14_all_46_18]PIQ33142.1 MAG: aminoacyl-tRNA hydrolase [Candidatus Yonathbacteria bacterium CG17_big_fil_post_rev_8_21_14_2_50_46_19]PIX56026.1 MAG: aminoacyl-tRNA hydrolase [Candidatus Yonathbacteria bacterium CG_4_10_14_3_um_filter_47_65]PIY57685.1 MAG: aminoacyl-tRNA hydrolase [Candidatus Yonathbact
MNYCIAGLGNPGDEYAGTRHNTGRSAVLYFHQKHTFSDWKKDLKTNALVSKEKIGKHTVTLVLPDNFMNNSGKVLSGYITDAKKAERLIVIYDDIDLPIGNVKISFDRGSGGHRGVESVIKRLRTRKFIRVRVGISPSAAKGSVRKPTGEERVVKFLMSVFSSVEQKELKRSFGIVTGILDTILAEGKDKAMCLFN